MVAVDLGYIETVTSSCEQVEEETFTCVLTEEQEADMHDDDLWDWSPSEEWAWWSSGADAAYIFVTLEEYLVGNSYTCEDDEELKVAEFYLYDTNSDG